MADSKADSEDVKGRCCVGFCPRPKFLLGLLCILLIIILWVGASELIQFVFDDADFSKPFFLTFYSSLLFSIYLLGFVFVPKWREDLRLSWRILVLTYTSPRPIWGDQGSERGDANCADGDDLLPLLADETVLEDGRKLPHEVAWLAFKYSFPWLAGNYLFNLSLCMSCGTGTTVASNTVLSSTCALWALLLSVLILGENGSPVKFFSVATTILGAALVTGVDMRAATMLGDLLALTSALTFGLISVVLKKWIPEEGALNLPMFFGLLGVVHSLLCLPLLLALHLLNLETLQPISSSVLGCLTVNAFFGTVLSNVLWAKAIVLTSPLVTNLGTSLSIPLSFLADYLNPHSAAPPLEWQYLLGSALILFSFVAVSVSPAPEEPQQHPSLSRHQSFLPPTSPDPLPSDPLPSDPAAPRPCMQIQIADPNSQPSSLRSPRSLYSPKPGILSQQGLISPPSSASADPPRPPPLGTASSLCSPNSSRPLSPSPPDSSLP